MQKSVCVYWAIIKLSVFLLLFYLFCNYVDEIDLSGILLSDLFRPEFLKKANNCENCQQIMWIFVCFSIFMFKSLALTVDFFTEINNGNTDL